MGALTPLVQGHRDQRHKYWLAMLAFAAGALAAASLVGWILSAFGSIAVAPQLDHRTTLIVLGMIGLALGLIDLADLHGWHLQIPRQTSPKFRTKFGLIRGALLWGIDLGSGITTLVHYATYWLIPVAVILVGEPALGVAVMTAFALGRIVSLASVSLRRRNDVALVPQSMSGWWNTRPILRRINGAGISLLSIAVLLVSFVIQGRFA